MGETLVGYLQSVKDLNLGPPNTNPSSGRKEDLNPGPPEYKSSDLTTGPRRLKGWERKDIFLFLALPSYQLLLQKLFFIPCRIKPKIIYKCISLVGESHA